MRVLFYYRGIESLGVGYLMSYLRQHGHEIDLIFDPGLDDNLYMKVKGLKWLNRHPQLIERARAFRPELIAISSLTNLYPFSIEMARALKEKIGCPIIFGGHHAQALPEFILSAPAVDYVATGEGEIPLLDLANRLERGEDTTTIPGIWAKQGGEIHRTPMAMLVENLDDLPFPEKQLWYEYGAFHSNLEIFTGRGCPFRCTFCNIHYQREIFKGQGDFLRKRSIANVIEEFKQNLRKYDPRTVAVHDDNFTTNRKWVEEFCEAYRKEVNLPWYCFGYPTTINEKLVKAMKAANCMTIFMGVDSGDEGLRRQLMERPMSDELIFKSARTIKQAGIGLQISCIYGMPGETPEMMMKTFSMVDAIKPDQASSYVFYPFPKTKMYHAAVEQGYLGEQEQEMVRQGYASYHHQSILRHPHKDLATTLGKITPVYNKTPEALRPLMRWIIEHRMHRLATLLYVIAMPISFPFLGAEAIRVTLRMAWKATTLSLRRRLRGGEPLPHPRVEPPPPVETRSAA